MAVTLGRCAQAAVTPPLLLRTVWRGFVVHNGKVRTVVGNIGRLVVRPDANGAQAIDDAAMIVNESKVAWTGKQSELTEEMHLDAGGRLVTPGLIDAHTHLVFGGDRADEFAMRASGATYEEIAASGRGIKSTVAKTRAATEHELFETGLKRARWMIANGTTMIEAKTGYGLSVDDELKCVYALRKIQQVAGLTVSATLLPLHAVPPEHKTKSEYVDFAIDEMLPSILEAAPEIEWLDAFIERGYFEADDAHRLAAFASAHDLGLRLHVDQLTEGGGAALAARLGAKTADHLEQTGAEGIAAMANAGTFSVLLPVSVYALGKSKFPDARAMLDAGLPVVLASDFNPGSSPTPSLPFVMSLACTHMRMTPDETLVAVTVNAASSLERSAGSLEVGKLGDFVLWDLNHERELAYWIAAPVAHQVFANGKFIFSNRAEYA